MVFGVTDPYKIAIYNIEYIIYKYYDQLVYPIGINIFPIGDYLLPKAHTFEESRNLFCIQSSTLCGERAPFFCKPVPPLVRALVRSTSVKLQIREGYDSYSNRTFDIIDLNK